MKNIFKNLAFLFLAFNCYSGIAQFQGEQLVGTWVFDYETSLAKMDPEAKAFLDKIDLSAQKKIEQAYKGRKIVLESDGVYEQRLVDNQKIKGEWRLDDTGKNIIITINQSNLLNLEIKGLTSDSLIVKLESKGEMKTIMSKWYFIKKINQK